MSMRKKMKARKKQSFGKYREYLKNRIDTQIFCIILALMAMDEDGDVHDEITGATEEEMDAALEELRQMKPTLNNIKNKMAEWQDGSNTMLRYLSVDFL